MVTLIDISPTISSALAVWPGDTAFSRKVAYDTSHGDHLTLSSVTTTLHLGAHADAPNHYARDGRSIEQVPLSAYVGPCTVMTPTIKDRLVVPGPWLDRLSPVTERVILRTASSYDHSRFAEDFVAIAPQLIPLLKLRGTVLVGIDTPSVDPFDSKDLPTHQALYKAGMVNLEGLDLSGAVDGDYELIALPLKIAGADASPVRAILRR
jgi:arylformamidase